MTDPKAATEAETPGEPIFASQGIGPLLERRYFATVEGAGITPEVLGRALRERFVKFAPPETATFSRCGAATGPLEVGDELDIQIALRGPCRVRVVCVDPLSLTLRTLKGHPEAGRITFGAFRDEKGRPAFQIMSRTRASGVTSYLGYLLLGKQMQSRCWIRFIDKLISDCGGREGGGKITVRTMAVEENDGDRPGDDSPLFGNAPTGDAHVALEIRSGME